MGRECFLEGVLASTGHRGRVDARGRHRHAPACVTRTAGHVPALLLVKDEGAAPAAAALDHVSPRFAGYGCDRGLYAVPGHRHRHRHRHRHSHSHSHSDSHSHSRRHSHSHSHSHSDTGSASASAIGAAQPRIATTTARHQRSRRRRCAFVDHEKERLHGDARFASSPAPDWSAGRGHRRGLDGPSMPKTTSRNLRHPAREC